MALQRAVYRPRDAEHTVLHQVVAEHLEAFLTLYPDLLRGGHDSYHSLGMCRVFRLQQHGHTRQF